MKVTRLIRLGALLAALIPAALSAQNGSWSVDSDGNWSNAANWSGSTIADGPDSIASFVNTITASRTVTSDVARTNGSLVFTGSGALNWTLTNSAAYVLNNASGLATITVSSNTANINASSGGLSGTNTVLKNGGGTLNLQWNNSYSGGTVIGQGTVALVNNAAGQLGTGSITITNGAILALFRGNTTDDGSTSGNLTNALVIPTGHTGTIWHTPRGPITGNLTGGGTLNLRVNATRGDMSGNWSVFAGQINVTSRTGTSDFRQANANGYTSGKLNLASGVNMYYTPNPPNNTTGINIPIGELSGAAGSTIQCGTALGRYVNWQIGAANTSSTFGGNFANTGANGYSRIYKVGTGTLTLTNNNTFASPLTAAVAVNQGKLVLATGGSISNSAITVAASATNGILVLSTGSQAAETNVVLSAGSSLEFNYGTTTPSTSVAPLQVLGTLTANSTVVLSVLGGVWTPGTYPLVKYAGTLGGSGFAAFSLGTLPLRVAATLNNNTGTSTIELVVSAINEPLKWTAANANWDIATSSNWKDAASTTTTYQEQLGLGDQVVFDDTASGIGTITVTNNTGVTPASVTFSNVTKNYVLTGTNNILGAAALTKTGAGTLTIQNTNSFSGGLYVNGGTVNFSSLANLGTGGLNFGGGTLQFASGNVEDISLRTVWFGPGGGTIDDGGNTLTFTKPIGNSGVGGFTKTGVGTLTLTGTNRYSGNTVVANGTLALAANTYISNSAAIIVNSGKVLDATFSGLRLTGNPAQILAGAGTVNGTVLSSNGIITPGTNGVVGTLTFANDLTIAGGTVFIDLATNTAQRDLISVGSSLSLYGGTLQLNVTGTLTNGVYKLIQYAGSLNSGAGSAANLVLSGYSQTGKNLALSDSISGEIDLVVTAQGGASITWLGNDPYLPSNWDVETTANFTNSSLNSAVQFVQGDKPTFDDSSATTTVNLMSALQPGSVTVTANANNYVFQDGIGGGVGKLTGTGGITKNGSSTLTIATANNNTGPTVINNGTVQVGAGSTLGDLGLGTVTNNGALIYNQSNDHTQSGVVTGTGSLTQQGSAVLTLATDNTYSGPTTITAGSLQLGAGGASGSLGSGAVTNDGVLIYNHTGAFTVGKIKAGPANLGEVRFNGAATVTLTNGNTYINNTVINNGVVKLAVAEAIPSAATVAGSAGWLVLDGGASAAGVFDLNGFNQTVNALNGNAGTVSAVITNSGSAGTNMLTVGTPSARTYNGTIVDNPTGAKTALTVRGTSSLRLNGNNTYTGGTFVGDTATLIYAGATIGNGGQITLSNGATFYMQSGFPGNNVFIAPNSAGTIGSASAANGYSGLVIGDSTATNIITVNVAFGNNATKQFQSMTGTVQIATGGSLRFSSTSLNVNGGDNATFEILGSLNTRNGTGSGAGVSLGALTGTGNLNGAGNADGNGIYIIGAKNLSTTFSGNINGVAPRATSIVKTGTGTLTLEGTLSYDGSTTINNGMLALAVSAELDDSPTINILSNATLNVTGITTLNLGNVKPQNLTGIGTITGNLSANSTYPSTITYGTSGTAGTLVVSGDATLNSGTTNVMDFSTVPTTGGGVNDLLQVGGNLTLGGTVYVRPNFPNGGVALNQPYTIMTYGGTLTGDTNNLALNLANTVYSHLLAEFSTNTPGAITVTFTGASNLVWQAAATNSWQVGVVTNWLDGVTTNNYAQLDTVTFDDSASNFTAVLVGTLTPKALTVNSSSNYLFNGAGILGGATGITKSGTGQLTIANTGGNTYNGAVTINNGVLKAGIATALGSTNGATVVTNSGALDVGGQNLGAEPVTVSGSGSGSGAILNSGAAALNALQFVTLAGDTTFGGTNRWDIRANTGGSLTANGYKVTKISTNDIYLVGLGNTALGNLQIQQGRIGVQDSTLLGAGGTLTLAAGSGLDFWLTTVTNTKAISMTNATISGSSGTNVYGGPITLNLTETITAATPFQLNGPLGGAGNLVKNGAGVLTLAGTNNYSGTTTVSVGTLALVGTSTITNSTSVDVASGAVLDVSGLAGGLATLGSAQTLKGNGTVNGSVTAPAGSTVSPGEGAIGTLTVTNTITLAGNTVMEINRGGAPTCDVMVATNIQYGGTLTVNNLGGAPQLNDFFRLFKGAYTGTFVSSNLPALGTGLVWTNTLAVDGTIAVVAGPTVNTTPTNITAVVTGNILALSWPGDHLGWTLLTNSVDLASTNDWHPYAGSTTVNSVNITINPAQPKVFFRMAYPYP